VTEKAASPTKSEAAKPSPRPPAKTGPAQGTKPSGLKKEATAEVKHPRLGPNQTYIVTTSQAPNPPASSKVKSEMPKSGNSPAIASVGTGLNADQQADDAAVPNAYERKKEDNSVFDPVKSLLPLT